MRRAMWLDWLGNSFDLLTTRVKDRKYERGEDEMSREGERLGMLNVAGSGGSEDVT